MPSNPLDDLAAREAALRQILFGRTAGGILGAVRQPPRSAAWLRAARLGHTADILAGRWWSGIWERAHDRLDPALIRISRESGVAAWREFAAGFTERGARELALEIAEGRAAALVAELQASTGAGLEAVVRDLRLRDLALQDLREELAARLGPTVPQLERIRRWEAAQRLAEVPRAEILAGVRSRARNAVRLRADVIASDAFVAQVNAARDRVFAEQGLLVYSENKRDNRVRKLHKEQTRVTLRQPVPAGERWPPSAPFQDGPPYEIRCRCWRAIAGELRPTLLPPSPDLTNRPPPVPILR